jgi:hypothetical protein
VGAVDSKTAVPLIEQYLGTLPAQAHPAPRPRASLTSLPFSFPKRVVQQDVCVPMVEATNATQITFPVELTSDKSVGCFAEVKTQPPTLTPHVSRRAHGLGLGLGLGRPAQRYPSPGGAKRIPAPRRAPTCEQVHWVALATRLLESRLLSLLRFKYGEVYSVSVSAFFGAEGPANKRCLRGDVAIYFTCDPAAAHRLRELALDELSRLQVSRGPPRHSAEGPRGCPPAAEQPGTVGHLVWGCRNWKDASRTGKCSERVGRGAMPSGRVCGGSRGEGGCGAARADVKVIWSVVAQEEGPSTEQVATAVELDTRAYEVAKGENSHWAECISNAYQSRFFDNDVDAAYTTRWVLGSVRPSRSAGSQRGASLRTRVGGRVSPSFAIEELDLLDLLDLWAIGPVQHRRSAYGAIARTLHHSGVD